MAAEKISTGSISRSTAALICQQQPTQQRPGMHLDYSTLVMRN